MRVLHSASLDKAPNKHDEKHIDEHKNTEPQGRAALEPVTVQPNPEQIHAEPTEESHHHIEAIEQRNSLKRFLKSS